MNRIYTVLICLTTFSYSCQNEAKEETASKPPTEQSAVADLTKRPSNDAPRSAADRVVRALYFEHDTKENPFLEANSALAEQFFTKEIATLLIKEAPEAKANRKRTNPLFNESDSNVKKRWVLPAAVAGEKAVVFVTYQSDGKEKEMRCEMNQQANGRWRIADIVYADGRRLTELLK